MSVDYAKAVSGAMRVADPPEPDRLPGKALGSNIVPAQSPPRKRSLLARANLAILRWFNLRLNRGVDTSATARAVERLELRLHDLAARSEADAARLETRLEATTSALVDTIRYASVAGGAPETSTGRIAPRAAPAPLRLGRVVALDAGGGHLLVHEGDEALVRALIETRGALEPGTAALLAELSRPGDTFLEIGAGAGAFVLQAARQVGPSGSVLAIEETPRTADLLKAAATVNGLSDSVYVAAFLEESWRTSTPGCLVLVSAIAGLEPMLPTIVQGLTSAERAAIVVRFSDAAPSGRARARQALEKLSGSAGYDAFRFDRDRASSTRRFAPSDALGACEGLLLVRGSVALQLADR